MRVCPHCRLIYQNAAFEVCGLHGVELVEQDLDPMIGWTLDRYELIELLGAGAMGRVYRAKHTALERAAAIKIMYGDYACEENFRLRFEREAQAIGQMRHPNIVGVTDFGALDGLPFLVMDHVEGRTLEWLIDEQAPFALPRAANILRQIAAGLAEAHARGFVHRDIKPNNILISGDEPNEKVAILDFGIVSMIATPSGDDRLTMEGTVLGTPMYMSPEQTADPDVTPSSDLYSIGVILYEMLAGRPPFLYEGRMQMMIAHVTEAPPPLPECGGLEKLAMALLQKEPNERPSSAEEVIGELDRLMQSGFSKIEAVDRPTKRKTRETHAALLRFDTFPALASSREVPWTDDRLQSQISTLVVRQPSSREPPPGLPTVEFPSPAAGNVEVVRRAWEPGSKWRGDELIPVLVFESDPDIEVEIERRLDNRLFRAHQASRLDAGLRILEQEPIRAIVLNLKLPDSDGLVTLDRVRAKAEDIPIIVVSKLGHEWLAVESIRRGADDYLTCSAEELRRLQRSVRFGMERRARKTPQRATPRPLEKPRPTSTIERPRSRALSVGFGSMVFAIGLLAGLLVPETESRQIESREITISQSPPPIEAPMLREPQLTSATMLSINSRPTGAGVWIDGVLAGKTPLILSRPTDVDEIEVELRLADHQTWSKSVTKNESGHFVVNAELVPAAAR